ATLRAGAFTAAVRFAAGAFAEVARFAAGARPAVFEAGAGAFRADGFAAPRAVAPAFFRTLTFFIVVSLPPESGD
ncbi:MAG TPA: hypothetical protein VGD74_02495, partial [Vulgatibacter sp.]